jgi:acetyltransferase-like isoleucine patch superfamily enzyme
MSGATDALLSRFGRLLRLRDKPAGHFVMRAIDVTRAKWSLRGYKVGRGVSVQGPLFLDVQGELEVGDRVSFVGNVLPTSLIVHSGAVLSVGEESVFNYGVSVEAGMSVTIGRRCMFGSFVRVGDRDGQRAGPIVIGDDVWLAHGVIIGPGVTIGSGSVVAAGSVVTKNVPPQSMALGNPARTMSLSLRTGAPDS